MTKLNPYLSFPGTANLALEFYQEVFTTKPDFISRFKDMPKEAGHQMPENGELIMHASLPIGDDLLMISDTPDPSMVKDIDTTRTHISIHPDSKDEANRMFALLSKDGTVFLPIADQFWGDYFGMCKDKFGIHWMINYSENE